MRKWLIKNRKLATILILSIWLLPFSCADERWGTHTSWIIIIIFFIHDSNNICIILLESECHTIIFFLRLSSHQLFLKYRPTEARRPKFMYIHTYITTTCWWLCLVFWFLWTYKIMTVKVSFDLLLEHR